MSYYAKLVAACRDSRPDLALRYAASHIANQPAPYMIDSRSN